MDAISPLILVLLSLLAGAAVTGFVLKLIDREDDKTRQVLEMIEMVLEVVKRQVQDAMKDVPIEEVEASATAVYRQYISGTVLEKVMDEQTFVGVVVERWRLLAGIEVVAFKAVQLRRVVAGS